LRRSREPGGTEGAVGEGAPARGRGGQPRPLARSVEDQAMLAHHGAAAQAWIPISPPPRGATPLPPVNGDLVQSLSPPSAAAARADRPCPEGASFFPVVRLHDLDVVAAASRRAPAPRSRNRFTPTLMFGARTMGHARGGPFDSFRVLLGQPVVPMTGVCRRRGGRRSPRGVVNSTGPGVVRAGLRWRRRRSGRPAQSSRR
jgi:hypothetical protein